MTLPLARQCHAPMYIDGFYTAKKYLSHLRKIYKFFIICWVNFLLARIVKMVQKFLYYLILLMTYSFFVCVQKPCSQYEMPHVPFSLFPVQCSMFDDGPPRTLSLQMGNNSAFRAYLCDEKLWIPRSPNTHIGYRGPSEKPWKQSVCLMFLKIITTPCWRYV